MGLVYFGTYTDTDSRGIYVSRFEPTTGRLSEPSVAAAAAQPSFLAFHPSGTHLYAVNELQELEGRASGGVSAFAVDPATGDLRLINRQPSEGASPCHLVVAPDGRHLLVANYHGGSVAVLPIARDGSVWPATCVVRHEGRGPSAERQEGPHAHSIHLDAETRRALAVDLGADRIFLYDVDAAAGRLTPADPAFVPLAPGSGPRHLAFHPNRRWLYVDNELLSTVAAFERDAGGSWTPLETVPTLPQGWTGANTTAEIALTPDGRFLYVSNRGHDSLAVFAVDPSSGALTPRGHTPTLGRTPRHFAVDPAGRYLLAAHQDSDDVVVFRIDERTGALVPTGSRVSVPRPVCVLFVP